MSFIPFAGKAEVPYKWSKPGHAESILHGREECWEQLYTALSQSLNLISFILPDLVMVNKAHSSFLSCAVSFAASLCSQVLGLTRLSSLQSTSSEFLIL